MSHFTHLLAFNPLDAEAWLRAMGPWATVGLIAIIFAESGLLIGFFLPGDSILFLAGFFASPASKALNIDLNIWVIIFGCTLAAIAGDQVGYLFGKKVGPALFTRPDSRLFKQENVAKAQKFFDEKGAKTIILARFVPIVRTFAPIVAGVAEMRYSLFVRYNVVGGTLWAAGVPTAGYLLGKSIPPKTAEKYIYLIVIVIVAVSLLPVALEYRKHKKAAH
ncbi:MAG: VTT domain-containing protein [Acidimicrobiia bacterium]